MPMYDLLEYSDNYSVTSGSLWNHYRDKGNNNANEFAANYKINDNKATRSKSFECNSKILGSTPTNINRLYTKFVFP